MLCKTGNVNGQMKLLRIQRESLLDDVYMGQKQIDCLDYLVYRMGKEIKEEEIDVRKF